MGLLSVLGNIFSFKGVSDSALRIVDKISGTDWTPQQQAEFILKHAEVTKYQSPMRRFIAFTFVSVWALFSTLWVGFMIYGRLARSSQALLVSSDIASFMTDNINLTLGAVVTFYFVTQMKR